MFKYSLDNKRYHTLNYYNKNKFNSKVFKVSLNGGFTCPNIDGTVAYGGCIYCKSGSGVFGGEKEKTLKEQFNEVKEVLLKKWPNSKYIAYFQANSNTYGSLDKLKSLYEEVLTYENVVGLSIATRCDCFSDEIYEYLADLNKRTNLTIELGLQTIHDKTSDLINRSHSLTCFTECVAMLRSLNIEVVVHIINGLPYETKEMMLDTVKFLNKQDIQGIKIHMLIVLSDTRLETLYNNTNFHILTKDEYVDIVCDQLELLNDNIVIHRITSDNDENDIILPLWLNKKLCVLNEIDKTLNARNTYQGFRRSVLNMVKKLCEDTLKDKDIAIDMTVGNSNDILFLANILKKGFVYGFDIQDIAIENTDKLLKKNNLSNYKLFKLSHDKVFDVLEDYKGKISIILFNLGYLPNGDKSIKTTITTTIEAINCSIELLNEKGSCIITVYRGNVDCKKEEEAIIEYLDDNKIKYETYMNTANVVSPYLIIIKK